MASVFNYFIIALDLSPVVFFTPPEEAIGEGYFFCRERGGDRRVQLSGSSKNGERIALAVDLFCGGDAAPARDENKCHAPTEDEQTAKTECRQHKPKHNDGASEQKGIKRKANRQRD